MGISNQANHFYEFGPFRLEPARHRLLRDGRLVPLPPKAFDTLSTLVQHNGEMLRKDELIKTIWPNTFVEENNLTQCISTLRKALGESDREHRYIETVTRLGYRFAAPVRELEDEDVTLVLAKRTLTQVVVREEQEEEEIAAGDQENQIELDSRQKQTPAAAPAHAEPFQTKRWKLVLAVTLTLLIAGAALFKFRLSRRALLTERDSILLGEFINTTGEPVFDGALKQALAVKLEESPVLDVIPEQRVRETLSFMGRSPDERLTTELAIEVCQRRGVKALVTGSIAPLGSHYVVGLNVVNCSTGDSLAREQFEADSREHVLGVVGRAASELRTKLGEQLSSVQKFDAPVEQATTVSLPALRSYAIGDELRAQGRETQAIPYYRHAIERDPNFAMAHARLAAICGNEDQADCAREEATKAFALRERVSEREKFYIQSHYYDKITGDIDKQIENAELWRHSYPRDWYPYNALNLLYSFYGEYNKAADVGREAVRLNPSNSIPYSNLAYAYLCLNRFDDAKAVCSRAIVAGLDNLDSEIHTTLYEIAHLQGDTAGIEHELAWSRGKNWEGNLLPARISVAAASGKVREARSLLQRSREIERQRGFPAGAAILAIAQALAEVEFGYEREAHEKVLAALAVAPTWTMEGNGAIVLARAGDVSRADALVQDLSARFPSNTWLNRFMLPAARAAICLSRDQPERAIELAQAAMTYPPSPTTYFKGLAYLRMRSAREATGEFQKLVDFRGGGPLTPYYALAHLGLARSQALAGETVKSHRTYQRFFDIWKNADTDLPILCQARAEYDGLKQSAAVRQ